jgi:uroporphyrin-III C-methyltransferase
VTLVGAGPGAADLVTVRGWRRLQEADVVVYDRLVGEDLYRDLSCRLINAGKRCGQHRMAQTQINDLLIELARAGERVVRLKGGDPTVLGRGMEEAIALSAAGIAHEIVPGVTSAISAPLFAGIPVTHRGVADSFCVLSAHPRAADEPFSIPPYHPKCTLVILMGVKLLARWRHALLEHGYPADLPVALVSSASTPDQSEIVCTLASACERAGEAALCAPTVAVIGEVVRLRHQVAMVRVHHLEREKESAR